MKIYVGNLPYNTSEQSIYQLFSRHGEAEVLSIVNTRLGSPHGYGFVHMPDGASAEQAISKLDGLQFQGYELTVRRARH